jgi:hypothetical protein
LKIDFLPYKSRLRFTRSGETTYVFDPIRKKELVLTPEELLRQLVLVYLLEEKKYPANRIRVEIGIEVNTLKKRCDLVVFDADIRPWLLLECKSPKVPLNQATFEQAARYNLQLKAPFLAVTNGLATYCCALDFGQQTFSYLTGFPDF